MSWKRKKIVIFRTTIQITFDSWANVIYIEKNLKCVRASAPKCDNKLKTNEKGKYFFFLWWKKSQQKQKWYCYYYHHRSEAAGRRGEQNWCGLAHRDGHHLAHQTNIWRRKMMMTMDNTHLSFFRPRSNGCQCLVVVFFIISRYFRSPISGSCCSIKSHLIPYTQWWVNRCVWLARRAENGRERAIGQSANGKCQYLWKLLLWKIIHTSLRRTESKQNMIDWFGNGQSAWSVLRPHGKDNAAMPNVKSDIRWRVFLFIWCRFHFHWLVGTHLKRHSYILQHHGHDGSVIVNWTRRSITFIRTIE